MTTDVATVDTGEINQPQVTAARAQSRLRGVTPLLVQFVLAGLVALVLLATLAGYISRRAGTRESIRDAKARNQVFLQAAGPSLLGTVRGDATQAAQFDASVRRVIAKNEIRHVRVWAVEGVIGTIKYSDQTEIIGRRFELRDDALKAYRSGESNADVNNLEDPENQIESRTEEKLLEVYAPFMPADGTTMLFETYLPYKIVSDSAARTWRAFAPTVLGSLAALQLVQIPLAGRLARRVRAAHAGREQALDQALEASDTERRRIARDLHDGAVQDLAGVTYSLAVIADKERQRGDHESERTIRDSIVETRRAIQGLRSLVVEIYPPNLADTGLVTALDNLAAPLVSRGIDVKIDVADVPLSAESAPLLFRLAQESLRNVARHASASSASVTVTRERDKVVMLVRDDGVGFDLAGSERRGHFGLRIMRDLVAGAGGRLSIETRPGAGTLVHVEVPA